MVQPTNPRPQEKKTKTKNTPKKQKTKSLSVKLPHVTYTVWEIHGCIYSSVCGKICIDY